MSSPVFANNAVFTTLDVNDMSAPWRLLKTRLLELGYELTTADNNNLEDCERIIFLDTTSMGEPIRTSQKIKRNVKCLLHMKIYETHILRSLYREALQAGMLDKMILIIWEGRSVCPQNFYMSNWKKFKKILTWDDDLVDTKKFFKFILPVPSRTPMPEIPFESKKLLVNVSYNKYSTYHAELYSERRKSIGFFDANYPNDFDLFGMRWNQPVTRPQILLPWLVKKYATYRGSTKDKQATVAGYKFTLAYENNADANGYVTEKMFDVLCAQSVPVYLGAPNITDYVPADVFIDRRKFKNDADLATYLLNIPEKKYEKFILAGQNYLKSEMYKKFSAESFCNSIISSLALK